MGDSRDVWYKNPFAPCLHMQRIPPTMGHAEHGSTSFCTLPDQMETADRKFLINAPSVLPGRLKLLPGRFLKRIGGNLQHQELHLTKEYRVNSTTNNQLKKIYPSLGWHVIYNKFNFKSLLQGMKDNVNNRILVGLRSAFVPTILIA